MKKKLYTCRQPNIESSVSKIVDTIHVHSNCKKIIIWNACQLNSTIHSSACDIDLKCITNVASKLMQIVIHYP